MRSLAERIIEGKIDRVADPLCTVMGDTQFEDLMLGIAQTRLTRVLIKGQPNIVHIYTNEDVGRSNGEQVSQEYLLKNGRLLTKSSNPFDNEAYLSTGIFKSISILAKIALGQKIDSRIPKK